MPELDATVGGATANSYNTLDELAAYFAQRLRVSAWTNATEAERKAAALEATRELELLDPLGDRATTTQRLNWPRYNVPKLNFGGSIWGCGLTSFYPEYYPGDALPQPLKDAHCELVLALLAGTYNPDATDRISEYAEDSIRVKKEFFGGASNELPIKVSALLPGLVRGPRLRRG